MEKVEGEGGGSDDKLGFEYRRKQVEVEQCEMTSKMQESLLECEKKQK